MLGILNLNKYIKSVFLFFAFEELRYPARCGAHAYNPSTLELGGV
jgi:hypothetical protein